MSFIRGIFQRIRTKNSHNLMWKSMSAYFDTLQGTRKQHQCWIDILKNNKKHNKDLLIDLKLANQKECLQQICFKNIYRYF